MVILNLSNFPICEIVIILMVIHAKGSLYGSNEAVDMNCFENEGMFWHFSQLSFIEIP